MAPGRDAAKAQACFERALAVARRQQAKSWELRAAISVARLRRDQGKRDEARDLLAPVYGWFSEGFDTFDLKEARFCSTNWPHEVLAVPRSAAWRWCAQRVRTLDTTKSTDNRIPGRLKTHAAIFKSGRQELKARLLEAILGPRPVRFPRSVDRSLTMPDIVLIHPRFPSSYWSMEHALGLLGGKAVLPVASLPFLAALTPAQYRVTLIDENVEPIDFDRCARADIVGLTGMYVQRTACARSSPSSSTGACSWWSAVRGSPFAKPISRISSTSFSSARRTSRRLQTHCARHVGHEVVAVVGENAPGVAGSADMGDDRVEPGILGGGDWPAEAARDRVAESVLFRNGRRVHREEMSEHLRLGVNRRSDGCRRRPPSRARPRELRRP